MLGRGKRRRRISCDDDDDDDAGVHTPGHRRCRPTWWGWNRPRKEPPLAILLPAIPAGAPCSAGPRHTLPVNTVALIRLTDPCCGGNSAFFLRRSGGPQDSAQTEVEVPVLFANYRAWLKRIDCRQVASGWKCFSFVSAGRRREDEWNFRFLDVLPRSNCHFPRGPWKRPGLRLN